MAFADEIEVLRRFYEAWDNFNEAYENVQEYYNMGLHIPTEEEPFGYDYMDF